MRLPWRRENSEKAPDIPWFWTLTIDGRPAANFDKKLQNEENYVISLTISTCFYI